jgi:periplasmic divalent cation tolerance protein
MTPTALVVLTTLASEGDARALVTALLGDHLIACGTLLPGARSLYRWQGEMTEEAEVVVLLKTDRSRWDALCGAVRERHPYAVPELLALPVERGLDRYLSWLTQEVVGDPQA